MDFRGALAAIKNDLGLAYDFKEEQTEILWKLNQKDHVFAQLPTGFGKSVCFAIHPLVQDKIYPEVSHLALVVSPLNALMRDQVTRWRQCGVSCAAILGRSEMDEGDVKDIHEGKLSILFTSPEAILDRGRPWWDAVLISQRERICLIAVDEAHCMLAWGNTFRDQYLQIPRLRAVLRETPVLMLTATSTPHDMRSILSTLSLSAETVALVPNRPEIYLAVRSGSSDFEVQLKWILDTMRRDMQDCEKMLVYTRDIDTAAEIAGWLTDELGDDAFLPGAKPAASTRLLDLYHGETHPDDQRRILKNFSETTHLRVLVATVAFGMGVEIPDVRKVVMWGPPKDVLTYWQEVGRAGRDGKQAEAIMYLFPHAVNRRLIASDMVELCQNYGNECIRKQVLRQFSLDASTNAELNGISGQARCCSTCDQ